MRRRKAQFAWAAALLIGACSSGADGQAGNAGEGPSAIDPDAAWMDAAEVRVNEDLCAGTSTVELINAAEGQRLVVDTETFEPDPMCHST